MFLSDFISVNQFFFFYILQTLIAWLERGECSKKNSNQFYSMIQTTNSHIRRLFNEKVQAEEELTECRERVKNHIQSIIEQRKYLHKSPVKIWSVFTHCGELCDIKLK